MPLQTLYTDILKLDVEAIVNSTHEVPVLGEGLDLDIHRHAGWELMRHREMFGTLKVTDAIITEGYELKASYVIHVVGPRFDFRHPDETLEKLYQTYINALTLADHHAIKSIAFPLIGSGYFGIPFDLALETAEKAIHEYLKTSTLNVYLALVDPVRSTKFLHAKARMIEYVRRHYRENVIETLHAAPMMHYHRSIDNEDVEDLNGKLTETFSDMLFRFIFEKKIDEVKMYQYAGLTKQHFSKIRSQQDYIPKRKTAMVLAVAMHLNLDETIDLLATCGYTFQTSNHFDLAIKFYISRKMYDIDEIDQSLFELNLETLRNYG